jgi:hypothetical protein
MADMHDGTGEGMLAFLDWSIRTGELPTGTARGFRTTATKVLSIDGEPSSVDVANMDPESYFDRFERLHRGNYSTGSMNTYRQRFRTTVAMYKALVSGDPNWKKLVPRPSSTRQGTGANRSRTPKTARPQTEEVAMVPTSAGEPDMGMITHTVPLRSGHRARLVLPENLTMADARRINAVVQSLAFDEEPDHEGKEVRLDEDDTS